MQYQKRNAADSQLIAKAAGDDLALIEAEINAGDSAFFSLGQCHIVTRSEITPRGLEWVIVCTQCSTPRDLKQAIKLLVAKARAHRFDCIRFHPTSYHRGIATARLAGEQVQYIKEPGNHYFVCYLGGKNGQ